VIFGATLAEEVFSRPKQIRMSDRRPTLAYGVLGMFTFSCAEGLVLVMG